MAKTQVDIGMLERAGRALGASKLKMQHHDYVKSLKENINVSKQKRKQLEKEYPNGIPVEKVGVNEEKDINEAVFGLTGQIKELSLVKEGDTYIDDNGLEQKYDLRLVGDQIDGLNNKLRILNQNTEDKAGFVASLEEMGPLAKSSSVGEIANYDAVKSRNYGKDGLNQRLNPETNEFEWYDQTVGKHVPVSQFNVGSAYDKTLENMDANNMKSLIDIADRSDVKKDRNKFTNVYKPKMMHDMREYVKENPTAVKNLIFEDDDFIPIRDNYLFDYYSNDMEQIPGADMDFNTWKNSDLGNAAVELLKEDFDDNDFFLDEYEMMLEKKFDEHYIPPAEEIIEDNKSIKGSLNSNPK